MNIDHCTKIGKKKESTDERKIIALGKRAPDPV